MMYIGRLILACLESYGLVTNIEPDKDVAATNPKFDASIIKTDKMLYLPFKKLVYIIWSIRMIDVISHILFFMAFLHPIIMLVYCDVSTAVSMCLMYLTVSGCAGVSLLHLNRVTYVMTAVASVSMVCIGIFMIITDSEVLRRTAHTTSATVSIIFTSIMLLLVIILSVIMSSEVNKGYTKWSILIVMTRYPSLYYRFSEIRECLTRGSYTIPRVEMSTLDCYMSSKKELNLGSLICGMCHMEFIGSAPIYVLSCRHVYHAKCLKMCDPFTRSMCQKCNSLVVGGVVMANILIA